MHASKFRDLLTQRARERPAKVKYWPHRYQHARILRCTKNNNKQKARDTGTASLHDYTKWKFLDSLSNTRLPHFNLTATLVRHKPLFFIIFCKLSESPRWASFDARRRLHCYINLGICAASTCSPLFTIVNKVK